MKSAFKNLSKDSLKFSFHLSPDSKTSPRLPGFTEEGDLTRTAALEAAQYEAEHAAARAFKTLASILNQARADMKAKREKDKLSDKGDGEIDLQDVEAKIFIDNEHRKKWVLYPDGKIKSGWDLMMIL